MISIRMFLRICLLALVLVVNSGCGSIFGPESSEEATPTPTRVPVPTFTPTPLQVAAQAAAEEEQRPATPEAATATEGSVERADSPSSENAPTVLAPTPTTQPSEPYVVVIAEIVNMRSGPGTAYDIIGSVVAEQQLPTVGRNAQGDWWQVCCGNGDQPGWLYAPLVDARESENVPIAVDIPPPPTPLPVPTAAVVAEAPTPVPVADTPTPIVAAGPPAHSGTAGNFDPNAQFHIVHYRVIGFGENNGGIFNNGGQHMIFINVIDENGQGIDGAVVKDILADGANLVTGNKGPGRTEFEMFWEPYKLYVASIPSGPVTSQVSNQMNTAKPHIPDIIGKLGPTDHEYAICPTPDDRCEPPFFHAHWSYEITFQKVK